MSRHSETTAPETERTMKREKAVAVGNRAGIVEWANAAWSRVTGYALEDGIAKPVADFLSLAGIEPEVVELVRSRFEHGEPCEIELPLDPPHGPRRWIHVSVESLRDRHGEVSHFAAIAWDVTAEKQREAEGPATASTHTTPGAMADAAPDAPALVLESTDLSAFARERVAAHTQVEPRTAFDVELPPGLPPVRIDRARVAAAVAGLLADAVAAVGDEWGTISVSTGVAHSEAVFVSPSYPRNCLLRGVPEGRYTWLEVHDTGRPADRTALAAISGATAMPARAEGRVARMAAARALLRAHGGELRIDADAGFGTRVILLLPAV